MRDVVALDSIGRRGQAERISELPERGVGAVVVGEPAHALHFERLAGVLGGHFGQAALVAPLRAANLDRAAALLGEPAAQQLALLDRVRDQHQPRDLQRALVVLPQKRRQHLFERFVLHPRQREAVAARHLLPADEQHLHHRLVAVHRDAEGVELGVDGVGGDLLLGDALDGGQLVAQRRRPLEVELVGRLAHRIVQLLDHHRTLAVEEEHRLVDHLAVFVGRAVGGAGRDAAADVVVEAGARV